MLRFWVNEKQNKKLLENIDILWENKILTLKLKFKAQQALSPRDVVKICMCVCLCVCVLFCCLVVSDSFVTPWTIAHQAPLSMGFPRQECWSGLPFPFPGDLPDPGIESVSPASPALAGRFFTTEPPGKPVCVCVYVCIYIYIFFFNKRKFLGCDQGR